LALFDEVYKLKKALKNNDLRLDNIGREAEKLLNLSKLYVKDKLGNNVAASHNRLLYMQNICEQMGRNPFRYAMGFYNVYWDTMLENMELFDYVRPLLNELQRMNINVGILTDLTAHIQYRKIERLGISDMVDFIVTSEEAGAEKHSEKMFGLMLDKIGIKPDEAIMVGDSMEKDVLGAEKVGIEAFLYDGSENFGDKIINIIRR
jgi:putative hydrolase of the HAD superfamily